MHRRNAWMMQSYSLGGANLHQHINTVSRAPRVHIPNCISIRSTADAGLAIVTNRQTGLDLDKVLKIPTHVLHPLLPPPVSHTQRH